MIFVMAVGSALFLMLLQWSGIFLVINIDNKTVFALVGLYACSADLLLPDWLFLSLGKKTGLRI